MPSIFGRKKQDPLPADSPIKESQSAADSIFGKKNEIGSNPFFDTKRVGID